jgi:hypothetical protein
MAEAHLVLEEMQCLLTNRWMQDTVPTKTCHHNHNVRWDTGIAGMTTELLAKPRVSEAAPAQQVGKVESGKRCNYNTRLWRT